MSQAKVDRYKQEKRNVKKIMAKEKRNWIITQIILIAIGIAVILWIGISLFQAFTAPSTNTANVQSVTYTLDSSALEDYLSSIEQV